MNVKRIKAMQYPTRQDMRDAIWWLLERHEIMEDALCEIARETRLTNNMKRIEYGSAAASFAAEVLEIIRQHGDIRK